MAKLKYLVIHCTDTPEGREVSKKDIERWHIKERGWSRVGYSDMIHLDGELENLINWDQDDDVESWEISNGARGHNFHSRHLVYVGGCNRNKEPWMNHYPPKDTRTPYQKETLSIYVKFMIKRYPNIKVVGHNQLGNKACPSFNVPKWLREIGIDEKHIGV